MSFADVKNRIEFVGFPNSTHEDIILAELENIFGSETIEGSEIARKMFNDWISANPNKKITIIFWENQFQVNPDTGWLMIDLAYLTNKTYIDNNGTAVERTLSMALVHELVHVLAGLKDTGRGAPSYDGTDPTDYQGKTVKKANEIYLELKIPEQNSYIGHGSTNLTLGTQYTNGAAINRSVVISAVHRLEGEEFTNWDSSDAGNSNDLLIGDANDNELISGAGNDFLYGMGGNDTLIGGTGYDTYVFHRGFDKDLVEDEDGEGKLLVGGVQVGVLIQVRPGSNIYRDADKNFTASWVEGNPTLTILSSIPGNVGSVTIQDWEQGKLEVILHPYEDPVKNIDPVGNAPFLDGRHWVEYRDPLAFDLDGDGLETTGISGATLFDHDGDGVRTGTGWLKGDDAFLALDRNGNGVIDSGRELFGVDTVLANGEPAADGFAALAGIDSNGDGQISALDALFGQLRLWRDLDQDGTSDEGELISLTDAGIASISLTNTVTNQPLAGGNVLTAQGTYTRSDGTTGTTGEFTTSGVGNLDLTENPFYREFTDAIALTDDARELPNMHGSGMVRDLREAASLDAQIVADVTALAGTTRAQMMNALDALMIHWAGTSTMETSFRQAQDKDYTLIFLPVGMNTQAYFAEPGQSYPEEIYGPLKQKQEHITQLIEILECFNGLAFVDVEDDRIVTGSGVTAMVGAVDFSGGATPIGNYAFYQIPDAQLALLEQSYALEQIRKIWSIIKGDRRGEGKDACTVIEGPEGKNHRG